MLDERAIAIATDYWAAHLGLSSAKIFTEPFQLIAHGNSWVDYDGAFALFRDGAVVVTVPSQRMDSLRPRLETLPKPVSALAVAQALASITMSVVGPASIAYTGELHLPAHPTRSLLPTDGVAMEELRQACDANEWDHGGSTIDQPCSGVFVDGRLVALAGYEIWGGTIAHIAIVTHPAFRGHGYGRSAVAHIERCALAKGLLPQYRTLHSNTPSMRIADSLGFESFATSMAIRF